MHADGVAALLQACGHTPADPSRSTCHEYAHCLAGRSVTELRELRSVYLALPDGPPRAPPGSSSPYASRTHACSHALPPGYTATRRCRAAPGGGRAASAAPAGHSVVSVCLRVRKAHASQSSYIGALYVELEGGRALSDDRVRSRAHTQVPPPAVQQWRCWGLWSQSSASLR